MGRLPARPDIVATRSGSVSTGIRVVSIQADDCVHTGDTSQNGFLT
jgi:hypothetical protein